MSAAPIDIVGFWRHAGPGKWFRKDYRFDEALRLRFEPVHLAAARGEYDRWMETAEGCLALLLLLDQFPRNMYRDTPQAFAFDTLARSWCRQGLLRGDDQALRPIERLFFCLPLEHAEDLADQQQMVALMHALAAQVPAADAETFAGFVHYAERHLAVIARFGRFPHRNTILGRASTPEEAVFLTQPGSSF